MLTGKLHRDRRGDTIIEVMIVLAVLGLAIAISYATANRSLLNARQAQENSQATAAAQSQLEQLVSIGCTSGDPECDITDSANPGYALLHPPGGAPFCIVNGMVRTSTDPLCPQQAPLPGSSVEITCLDGCASPRVFEVTVSWDDVLGNGRDTVRQDYTLPPTVAVGGGGPGGGGLAPGEILIYAPDLKPDEYRYLCQSLNNNGGNVYYYSRTGQPCAGGGTFLYFQPGNADNDRFNHACQFDDGRLAYTQFTNTGRCPAGGTYVEAP